MIATNANIERCKAAGVPFVLACLECLEEYIMIGQCKNSDLRCSCGKRLTLASVEKKPNAQKGYIDKKYKPITLDPAAKDTRCPGCGRYPQDAGQ